MTRCVIIAPSGVMHQAAWNPDQGNDIVRNHLNLTDNEAWDYVHHPKLTYFVHDEALLRPTHYNPGAETAWAKHTGQLPAWPIHGTCLITGPVKHENILGLTPNIADLLISHARHGAAETQPTRPCTRCGTHTPALAAMRLDNQCRACFADTFTPRVLPIHTMFRGAPC